MSDNPSRPESWYQPYEGKEHERECTTNETGDILDCICEAIKYGDPDDC